MKHALLAASAAFAISTSVLADDGLTSAPAGVYEIDNAHAYIVFSYDHQGFSAPMLRFTTFDSTINLDPEDVSKSVVTTTIPVAEIDSGVEVFDGHLTSADWFDAETYPTISFKSTSIETSGDETGRITGDLTVRDVTKPVVLDVVFNKLGETRDGRPKIGFSGETTIKRSEFGLGKYVPYVGDDVTIRIETEYEKSE